MSPVVSLVRITVHNAKAARRITGLPIEPRLYRAVALYLDGPVTVDDALTVEQVEGEPHANTPWLPMQVYRRIAPARGLHAKPEGREAASPEYARARAAAAERDIGDVDLPQRSPELVALAIEVLADRHVYRGTPLYLAIEKIVARILDPGALDVDALVDARYAASPAIFAAGAAEVEAAHDEAKRAREAERAKIDAARAHDLEEVHPGDLMAVDAWLVREPSIAAGPLDSLFSSSAGNVVAVWNDGISAEKDVQIAPGVMLCTRHSSQVRPMARAAIRTIPSTYTKHETEAYSGPRIGDQIERTRTVDRRDIRGEGRDYSNATEAELEFAKEQIAAATECHWRPAFGSTENVRARVRIANLYRGHFLSLDLARADLRERAAAKLAELNGRESFSDAAIDKWLDRVYRGDLALYSPGALTVAPPAPWLDRYYARNPDECPWRTVLAPLASERVVKNADAPLRAAGLVDGELTPSQRSRLYQDMIALGFKKSRVKIDGKLTRAWVREVEA